MAIENLEGSIIGDKYKILEKLGEGEYGITYKAYDAEVDTNVAIKILKSDNIEGWKEEARKAAKLRNVRQVATLYDVNEFVTRETSEKLKYIVSEYVEGITLRDFLKKGPVTADIILDLTQEICMGVAAIQHQGLEHGDLHAGNIMIVDPQPYDPWKRYGVKILDFGLARSLKVKQFTRDLDDIRIILLDCLERSQYYAGERIVADKKFQNLFSHLINRMEDPSPERQIKSPEQILLLISEIRTQASGEYQTIETKLKNPFDYLSVEEFPEDSDLVNYLYADNVPWLKETTGFGTMIISGPRGSGKSMVLKNMRILTKLRSKTFDKTKFEDQEYLGFYIHCHHSLYIPFAGMPINYDTATLEKFVHYLNLLLCAEILDSIIALENQKIVSINPSSKRATLDYLNETIFHQPQLLSFSPDSILSQCKSMIEKEIHYVRKMIINERPVAKNSAVGFIVEFIQHLDQTFDFFSKRNIYFLLDDYSQPKVQVELQKAINRLIGIRNNRFCFKISTERFGFIPKDLDGKDLQQDREFSYVDLGGRYIKYHKPERKQFIREIIYRRLKRGHVNLTPEQYFGTSKIESIATDLIRERNGGNKKSSRVVYSGFDAIYRLCMGDLSTLLQLCKEIYIASKAERRGEITSVDAEIQDQTIRNFSRRRLDMIKEIPTSGEDLYHLVEVFGNISKKYLYEYQMANRNSSYLEVSRIELTENSGCLSEIGDGLFRKLITEHIFLDAGGSYPWGKGISNLQLLLRPIYTPALKISYNNRYALRMSCGQLESFLTNPDEFEKIGTRFLKLVSEDSVLNEKAISLDPTLSLDNFIKTDEN